MRKAAAFTLATFSGPAAAQHVPIWVAAAVLSPLAVLSLCIVLGLLKRSGRVSIRHAALVLLWILLFSLASYFVENDYVIWTPLAIYSIHSVLLLFLVVIEIRNRIAGRDRGSVVLIIELIKTEYIVLLEIFRLENPPLGIIHLEFKSKCNKIAT